MKKEKIKSADKKNKATGLVSDQTTKSNTPPIASRTETGASGKVRAHAGKGMGNEGTNTSYADEIRND